MLIQNLGYPRIGGQRQLKKASEQFWAGKTDLATLHGVASQIKEENWKTHLDAGIALIPWNDFSYCEQTLNTSLLLGLVPARHETVRSQAESELDLYFTMTHSYQKYGLATAVRKISTLRTYRPLSK